jgi:hypothetical protein
LEDDSVTTGIVLGLYLSSYQSFGKIWGRCHLVSYFSEGQFPDLQRSLGMWGKSLGLCRSLGEVALRVEEEK